MKPDNLYAKIPAEMPEEWVECLCRGRGIRLERIVSRGHASPPGFWFDQQENEWVIVLRGSAALLFAGEKEPVVLKAGDYVDIPARTRHRIEWTDHEEDTVWLAAFYE